MCNVHMVVGAQCSFRSLHIFKIDMVELMESDKKVICKCNKLGAFQELQ